MNLLTKPQATNQPLRSEPRPLIVVCGPTASGKTALGIWLCKKFNGEIISADSRQVYRGLDIGTGKAGGSLEISKLPEKWVIGGVPIHLYDVVSPKVQYSVSDFVRKARDVLAEIWQRGKLPFLVGGTGFYIKALLNGLATLGIGPSLQLRSEYERKSAEELFEILQSLDPPKAQSLNESDRQNPRRLIRAIEITQSKKETPHPELLRTNYLMIGLGAPRPFLYQRVDRWVEEVLAEGLVEEVKSLIKRGYKDTIPMQGIIYQPAVDFLEERIEAAKFKERLQNQMHDYVRRQLTWFRGEKKILFFDISQKNYEEEVANTIAKWLNKIDGNLQRATQD